VLNDALLHKIPAFAGRAVLELGAGNGYFMPLALDHFSGQVPQRIVISDVSSQQLSIAANRFKIPGAEYLQLDVRSAYPFPDASFDLILAIMVFNEVSSGGLRRALHEIHRVLRPDGLLLVTVTHPAFIASLARRNQLKKNRHGLLTMPGANKLRLPIAPRSQQDYERLLQKAGFTFTQTELHATEEVLNEKPALRDVGALPLALVLECRRQGTM
jgi:ubiquinone/menaquinone biosynthesis C-methylase UbiE